MTLEKQVTKDALDGDQVCLGVIQEQRDKVNAALIFEDARKDNCRDDQEKENSIKQKSEHGVSF